MASKLIILVLLAALGCVACGDLFVRAAELPSRGVEQVAEVQADPNLSIEERVFTESKDESLRMKPDATEQALREMAANKDSSQRENAEKLLEIAAFAESAECNRKTTFEKLSDILEDDNWLRYELNVLPVIRHWRSNLYDRCKEKLVDEEIEVIATFNQDDQMAQIENLMHSLLQARRSIPEEREKDYVGRRPLARGIVSYLVKKEALPVQKADSVGLKEWKSLVESQVGQLCWTVRKKMTPMVHFYKNFDKKLVKKIDNVSLRWIAYERLCRDIVYDLPYLIEYSYESILRKPLELAATLKDNEEKDQSKKGNFITRLLQRKGKGRGKGKDRR